MKQLDIDVSPPASDVNLNQWSRPTNAYKLLADLTCYGHISCSWQNFKDTDWRP